MKEVEDTKFAFKDNPIASDFELINKYSTDEFQKYRLKSKPATIDIALMPVDKDELEEYIEGRKKEFQDLEIRVPSPYTADIEEKDQDEEHSIEFQEGENGVYGLAFADPEYKLMVQEQQRIPRYRYYLTWKYFPEREELAEIEVYIPKDEFGLEKTRELTESLVIQ